MAFILQLRQFALVFVLLVVVGVHGRSCSNPSIRREWRTLSRSERADWINAVKCLARHPHDSALTPSVDPALSLIPPVSVNTSFYDDIVYLHMDLNLLVHFTGFFLPWHRAFIWGVEQEMKKKCNYKGVLPYWDWTQDAANPFPSSILDPDPVSGLGGWGDPEDDMQIASGAFSKDFLVAYPSPHRVRRNMTLQPFTARGDFTLINTTYTPSAINKLLTSYDGDFVGFQGSFESGAHAGPHLTLGGDMRGECPAGAIGCVQAPKWSPDDPMFFLHHAMVDKLWYEWQHRNESNLYAFSGGSVTSFNTSFAAEYPNGGPPFLSLNSAMPNDGLLWNNLTILDVMDTRANNLCYIYA